MTDYKQLINGPCVNRFQMFHLQSLAMNVIQMRIASLSKKQNVDRIVMEKRNVYVWMDTKTVGIGLLVSRKVRTFKNRKLFSAFHCSMKFLENYI